MNNYLDYRILLKFFSIIILFIFVLPISAQALTLSPTRFEISGDPGQVLTHEILLINENDIAETYYPSFSNFEAQGDTGSPTFVDPKDGIGTWIRSEQSSVYLSPRQQKKVEFSITIPNDAEPGGHFGVIFWGTSPATGDAVSIGAQTGILVLLSVNGDVKEEAGLLDFKTKDNIFFYKTLPVSFEYRFRNDGGDRIKPVGSMSIRNTLFLPSEKLDANPTEGNILPSSTRKFKVDWVEYERAPEYVTPRGFLSKFKDDLVYQWRNFAVGLYSANLGLEYGTQGQYVKKTVFFFVFPWQLVIVMILVLLGAFWGGKKVIQRYNKFIIEKARAGTKIPPDSSNA